MEWLTLEPKVNEIRDGLMTILEKLNKEKNEENILTPSPSFDFASELLKRPEYNIVVCGEVKRGKSTLINAIIGQEILPMGVKETTSQVFRISNAEQDSFFLVFNDGTKIAIDRQQLARYGSQTDADLKGEATFEGKILDYIQINTPVSFLPAGVSLVDTPGLGALYTSHSEITNGYISRADAVIFVMSAGAPLVQQEKEFLAKVFSLTPYVLFIMTKIDTVGEDDWVNLIRRNNSLLKDRFESSCYTIPTVYPVSSKVLLEAAAEKDRSISEMLLEDSYFPRVKDELMAIMFRTVGLSRNNFAFSEASKLIHLNLPRIEEQCKNVASENIQEQDGIRKNLDSLENGFKINFGEKSEKREKVVTDVMLVLNAAKTQCLQIFSTQNDIYQSIQKEIEELHSLESAQAYSKSMGQNVVTLISVKWDSIMNSAQQKIVKILRDYQEEISLQRSGGYHIEALNTDITIGNTTLMGGLRGTLKTALPTMGAYYAGSMLLGLVGLSIPIALPIVLLGTALWGWITGVDTAKEKELANAKNQLKKSLNEIVSNSQKQMMEVAVDQEKYLSAIDSFIYEVNLAIKNKLEEFYKKGQEQYKNDKKRLENQGKLKGEEKRKELVRLNAQRGRWLSIQQDLQKTGVPLKEVNKVFERA
jgi:GTPase Era involved in 16S rRNA processing